MPKTLLTAKQISGSRGKQAFFDWYHDHLSQDYFGWINHPPTTILRYYLAEGHKVQLTTIKQWMKEILSEVTFGDVKPRWKKVKALQIIDNVAKSGKKVQKDPTVDSTFKDDSGDDHHDSFKECLTIHPEFKTESYFGEERYIMDTFSLECSAEVDEVSVRLWVDEFRDDNAN